jgi:UDP-N-acetylmuramoyl-L-alanyl-D-glutamate--2,6-diaminopimelate ligase
MAISCINSPGIRLRDVLVDAQLLGSDIHVASCSSDSRQIQPGDLFVALTGARCDGHEFADEAVARGATAVLAERPLPLPGVPTCIVPDTREAYGQLCQAMAGDPSRHLRAVGVTGTCGKTTTSSLIAAVLTEAGARVGITGTLGYWDGEDLSPAVETTPSAPALADWMGRMVIGGCSHAVIEASSRALSQARLAGIEFDTVCVTNVQRDHLDYHGSLSNYRNAKARLLDCVSPTGVTILNADDPVSAGWLTRIAGPALTVATDTDAELTATMIERQRSEQTFLLSAGCETLPVRTRMIGDFHVTNCLIAAAVGLTYGIDLPTVVRGLEAVAQVPGRMERIECGQPFTVMVDYAQSPDALVGSLGALRQVTDGRIICVFGASGNRDRTTRSTLGSVANHLADELVLTSDNPYDEDPQQIVSDIRRGISRRGQTRTLLDRSEAIASALAAARPGDSVLIAGRGHQKEQIIGGQRYLLDDRQVARDILYFMADSVPNTEVRA